MMTTLILEDRFDLSSIQPTSEGWDRNSRLPAKGSHDERCMACNRPMANYDDQKGTAMVHMDTEGKLIRIGSADDDDEFEGSQGCFPIGAECAKKIPAAFRVARS